MFTKNRIKIGRLEGTSTIFIEIDGVETLLSIEEATIVARELNVGVGLAELHEEIGLDG